MAGTEYKRLGCIAQDCSGQHKAHGYCLRHYRQWQRGGIKRDNENCSHCGGQMPDRMAGSLYCRQSCKLAAWKLANRERYIALRTVHGAKRRAVVAGAASEAVDPFRVFDRDGWRCKLCGTKTPREKRGTHEPDAPELDHIIPISKGGEHSYLNTQCACRRCNCAKGAKPMGQLLLVG